MLNLRILWSKKRKYFILDNGDVLSMNKNEIKKGETIQALDVYVDGNRIGDIGGIVIKDRAIMANDGLVVVIANIDENYNLIDKVNITTRGFVLVNENEELINRIRELANSSIKNNIINTKNNYSDLKNFVIQDLTTFIKEETGRKPLILPVFLDIKDKISIKLTILTKSNNQF